MARPLTHCVARGIRCLPPRILRLQVRSWAPSSSPYSSHSTTNGSSAGGAVLSQTTSFLRNLDSGAEIFLVGTAHVRKRSAEEVRDLISLVKPDVVMVELCPSRAQRLRSGQAHSDADFFKEALGSLLTPGANFGQQMFKFSLQGMYRFLRSLGLDPGAEFKAAMEAAEAHGARVVYGDRDVQETLQRLAASVSWQDLARLFQGGGPQPPQSLVDFFENGGWEGSGAASRVESQVEAMKSRKVAQQLSTFLRQLNPALAAALIDERDEHMVQSLRRLKGRAVAVVGLAHLDGIERRWEGIQGTGLAPIPNRLPK